jgi:hypothetical protein
MPFLFIFLKSAFSQTLSVTRGNQESRQGKGTRSNRKRSAKLDFYVKTSTGRPLTEGPAISIEA